jgi:hypothetical protein
MLVPRQVSKRSPLLSTSALSFRRYEEYPIIRSLVTYLLPLFFYVDCKEIPAHADAR